MSPPKQSKAKPFRAACYMLVSCLAYSSTLKNYLICSFETAVDIQRTTWRYIPEDRTLHIYRCKILSPTYINELLLLCVGSVDKEFCRGACTQRVPFEVELHYIQFMFAVAIRWLSTSMELTPGSSLINSQVRGPSAFLRFLMLTAILCMAAPRGYRLSSSVQEYNKSISVNLFCFSQIRMTKYWNI
jgi:hypothetical protein